MLQNIEEYYPNMNAINISTNRRNLYYTYKYLFKISVQLKTLDFADNIKCYIKYRRTYYPNMNVIN